MKPSTSLRAVAPGSIVLASVLAAGAVVSAFLFEERELGFTLVVWLSAVIPAFLFAYLRGLGSAAVTLAMGMAALAVIQGVGASSGADEATTLPAPHAVAYAVLLSGLIVMVQLLHRERRGAEQATLVDRITGLPNRAYFDLAILQEFAAADRGRGLSVVVFDIDALDVTNRRFGRPSGDAVVNAFAKIVASNTRKENLSVHFDGGRFVSVLREADVEAATRFAQRVIDQLRAMTFPWGRSTASAGVAVYEKGMGSHEFLVGAADRALSNAKSGGRDLVAVAPDATEREAAMKRISAQLTGHGPPTPAPVRPVVWLVDDDASVRSAVKGMLVRHGYHVWDSDDPARTIARFVETAPEERPVLIVADVIMPSMTGPRMIAQIAEIDPAVKVLYISGYAQSEMTWGGAPGGAVATLAKPFGLEELGGALTQLLGAPPER